MDKNIKVVGLGGIGGWLVDPLCMHLNNSKDNYNVTLIDGDSFEQRNAERQLFPRLGNKAEIECERLRETYPKIHFHAKTQYLNADNVIRNIREDDIVFLGVDNHATRKIVSDRCEELDNVTLISGGNEYTDGNVIYYGRCEGKDVGKPPTKLFPKIAKPEDVIPSADDVRPLGCETQIQSAPQLVFTNNLAAAMMLSVFYAHEQGKADFEQVYFDMLHVSSRKTPEKPVATLTFEDE